MDYNPVLDFGVLPLSFVSGVITATWRRLSERSQPYVLRGWLKSFV